MTCALCGNAVCLHADLHYSGLAPARHAGSPTGRTCGAGTSTAHRGDASPNSIAEKTSFHVSTFNQSEANVCVG